MIWVFLFVFLILANMLRKWLDIGAGWSILLMFAIVCVTCMIYAKKTEITDERNKKRKIQAEADSIKAILLHNGVTSPTVQSIKNLEKQATDNLLQCIEKYNLVLNKLIDTQSSLGICTYMHNCLITSLEFRSMSNASCMNDFDPFQYSQGFTYISYQDFASTALKCINSKSCDETSLVKLSGYAKHLEYISECAAHPIRVTKARVIKKKDIAYFKAEGNVNYISNVHGGGVNVGAAIEAGVLAGGAAAVVASKIGTEIKTDILEKDSRKLFLYFYNNGALECEEIITNKIDVVYSLLRDWLPEKEYEYVSVRDSIGDKVNNEAALPPNSHKVLQDSQTTKSNKYAELKELKELLDLGIISRDEFERKKREILG